MVLGRPGVSSLLPGGAQSSGKGRKSSGCLESIVAWTTRHGYQTGFQIGYYVHVNDVNTYQEKT